MSNRRFGGVFLAVGAGVALVLAIVATVLIIVSGQRARGWVTTDAVIVEVNESWSRNDNGNRTRMYQPVVRFETPAGPVTCSDNGSSSTYRSVGKPIKVRYDPSQPTRCDVDPGNSAWVPWMLYGMAVLFLGIFGGVGITILRSGGRSRQESVGQENERLRRQVSELQKERQARQAGTSPERWRTLDERNDLSGRDVPQDKPDDLR